MTNNCADEWLNLLNANKRNNINKDNCFMIKPTLANYYSADSNWTDRAIKIDAFAKCWGVCVNTVNLSVDQTRDKMVNVNANINTHVVKEDQIDQFEKIAKRPHVHNQCKLSDNNYLLNKLSLEKTFAKSDDLEFKSNFDPNFFYQKIKFSQNNQKSLMNQIIDQDQLMIPRISNEIENENDIFKETFDIKERKVVDQLNDFQNDLTKNLNLDEESKNFLKIKNNYNLIQICNLKNMIMCENQMFSFNKQFDQGENIENISRLLNSEDVLIKKLFNEAIDIDQLDINENLELSIKKNSHSIISNSQNSIQSDKSVKSLSQSKLRAKSNNKNTQSINNLPVLKNQVGLEDMHCDLMQEQIERLDENNEIKVTENLINDFEGIEYIDDKWEQKDDNAKKFGENINKQFNKIKKKNKSKNFDQTNNELNLNELFNEFQEQILNFDLNKNQYFNQLKEFNLKLKYRKKFKSINFNIDEQILYSQNQNIKNQNIEPLIDDSFAYSIIFDEYTHEKFKTINLNINLYEDQENQLSLKNEIHNERLKKNHILSSNQNDNFETDLAHPDINQENTNHFKFESTETMLNNKILQMTQLHSHIGIDSMISKNYQNQNDGHHSNGMNQINFVRVDLKKVRTIIVEYINQQFSQNYSQVDYKKLCVYLKTKIPGISENSIFVGLLQECNKNNFELVKDNQKIMIQKSMNLN